MVATGKRTRATWLFGTGIVLAALTLRGAVTIVPPVISSISRDLPLDTATIGILGMLPTAAFALFGFLTPYVIRWASLERLIVISILVGLAGQLARVFAPNTVTFLVFSVIAFGGLGAGNVLLPPLVKKHFPTKVGLMTALYVTSLSVGTALPAQLAVPLTDAGGWQLALASWAGVSVVALAPWLLAAMGRPTGGGPAETAESRPAGAELKIHATRALTAAAATAAPGSPAASTTPTPATPRMNLWRSPTAWGLTLMFGCTSLNTYALFAWLPSLLTDAGLDRSAAGSMLALFAALGLPLSLLIPLVAAKMANPFPVVLAMLGCFVAGYLGLLLVPAHATWLWVSLAGLGPGTFPLSLLLINHRTRTHAGAGALSGFSQGMGYALACTGPLFFGLIHDWTGSWTMPFVFLFATLAVLCAGALVICRPKMLEDDFTPAPDRAAVGR